MQGNQHSNLASGRVSALAGRIIMTGKRAVHMAYNWRERRQLEALLRYDDARLDDIGVSRRDIEHVLSLPLSRNPSFELERRRGMQRSR